MSVKQIRKNQCIIYQEKHMRLVIIWFMEEVFEGPLLMLAPAVYKSSLILLISKFVMYIKMLEMQNLEISICMD
jgi:hypothetical protein